MLHQPPQTRNRFGFNYLFRLIFQTLLFSGKFGSVRVVFIALQFDFLALAFGPIDFSATSFERTRHILRVEIRAKTETTRCCGLALRVDGPSALH